MSAATATATDLANRLDGLADEARAEAKQLPAKRRDAFEVGYIRGAILDIAKQLRKLDAAPKGAAAARTMTRATREPHHA